VISTFPVIGDGLAWHVGQGNWIRIGVDPCSGSGQAHILPIDLTDRIHEPAIHFISQVTDPGSTSIWQQGWMGPEALGLVGNQALMWNNFMMALRSRHIWIPGRDDELVWQKAPHGVYTPKMGYIVFRKLKRKLSNRAYINRGD